MRFYQQLNPIVAVLSIDFQAPSAHLAQMKQEIDWILKALEDDPEKTKTGLARALNVDKSAISRLLRGERRLKFDEAQKASVYLGVSPTGIPTGFEEPGTEFTTESATRPTAPFYRVVDTTDGIWKLDQSSPIELRKRPLDFETVEGVFGFYVPNSDMYPRFRVGESVWTSPNRPAAIGEDALIMPYGEKLPQLDVFLCVLKSIDDQTITAQQYGSARERQFSRADWQALHVLGRN